MDIHSKLGGNKNFQCPQCGYTAHRDWNGARNIMIRALRTLGNTKKRPAVVSVIITESTL